jgi:tetratricopeptide (TPR) repeat protein
MGSDPVTTMDRRTFLVVAAAMTVAAALVRANNALLFPVLGGYDAFAHFTYVWYLAETGRVPLAHQGWEFFQPPLYYAWMAAVWKAAAGLDPEWRLRLGTLAVALLGLVPAGAAAALVRRAHPGDRALALLAAGSVLFLPMHLYSAGFVGNESLAAAISGLALWLAVRTAEQPSPGRAVALGLCLGAAMLTKFTAVVVVAAAFAVLAARAWTARRTERDGRCDTQDASSGGQVRRDVAGRASGPARFVVAAAVAAATMLASGGWHYARNLREYGTPFPLSRDRLFLARIENAQLQGRRGLGEYLLFDPGILYRPQWPRGLSLDAPRPEGVPYRAMRESIPTGLYANTWFDGFGGFALPPVTASEASRRAGQALLTLGLVPTGAVLLGLWSVLARARRQGWRDADVAALVALAAMAAVVVHGTRTVPTQAAVKGTYLMPVSVAFAYLFALGLGELGRRSAGARRAATIACSTGAALSALVFAYGLAVPTDWFDRVQATARVRNLRGVLELAGGNRGAAKVEFEAAARAGWHLGFENLAALALDRGDLPVASWMLASAAARQPGQSEGTVEERLEAIATTQAEYANARAVLLAAEGRYVEAKTSLESASRLDPSIPEVRFNAGMLELLESGGAAERGPSLARAGADFARSLELDPAFREATGMLGVVEALRGDCAAALPLLSAALSADRPAARGWPVETGPGDLNAAGFLRRRRIEAAGPELSPRVHLQACARS